MMQSIKPGYSDVFGAPQVTGISQLPVGAGIYGMLNRATRMLNVGQSENIRQRCVLHRNQLMAGTAPNLRMRRDADRYGGDVYFYFALELVGATLSTNLKAELNRRELWWVVQLQAHDERYGYVSEAGHCRTKGARFRDRERKLVRPGSDKYRFLVGVDIYDPIDVGLLDTWVPGS
jgi:hypothetical protein